MAIGINGMGRIGRLALRAAMGGLPRDPADPRQDTSLDIVHVNEVKGGGPGNPGFLPFRWTVKPYRGCSHACSYCFARPTHTYLGLDAGVDFDQRVVVKVNAVERLRAELRPGRWGGGVYKGLVRYQRSA